jgi:hypothetical protein
MLVDVFRFVAVEDFVHLVFEVKLEFFQPVFFDFVFESEMRLALQGFKLIVIFGVLSGQTAKCFVRLHQVRLQLFLRVLHQGHHLLNEVSTEPNDYDVIMKKMT